MNEQLLDAWQINNRINLYLLDAIAPDQLDSRLTSKGRSAGEQFAHIHNVRLMWVKAALPESLAKLTKIEKENSSDKTLLQKSLTASGEVMLEVFARAIEQNGKVKGFKPHATAFLGYLISHEAHHRSQIILALKQSGRPLEKKILPGAMLFRHPRWLYRER